MPGYLWVHMRNCAESMGYNIPQYVKPVKIYKASQLVYYLTY